MSAWLSLDNRQIGQRVECEHSRITIGHSVDCDLILQSPAVGRLHAVITREGGGVFIEDMSTRNGTWLNDKRIEGRVQIQTGDMIRIADIYLQCHFKIELPPPSFEQNDASLEDELLEDELDPAEAERNIQESESATNRALLLEVLHEAHQQIHYYEHDRRLAADTQQSLLSRSNIQIAGYDIFLHINQANKVGGDVCDCLTLPDGRKLLYVADIAGKSTPAALLAAWLVAEVRLVMGSTSDLLAAMARINADFPLDAGRFATMLAVVIDPTSDSIAMINAGSAPALLYRGRTGAVENATADEACGLPLGITVEPAFEYKMEVVSLQPDDQIILYTDGITEQLDAQMRQLFGRAGIVNAIGAPGLSCREVGERILASFREFLAGNRPTDDQILVCLGRSSRFRDSQASKPSSAAVQHLKELRRFQIETWGQIDPAIIGRVVSGTATPEEMQVVEREIRSHPELGRMIEILRHLD